MEKKKNVLLAAVALSMLMTFQPAKAEDIYDGDAFIDYLNTSRWNRIDLKRDITITSDIPDINASEAAANRYIYGKNHNIGANGDTGNFTLKTYYGPEDNYDAQYQRALSFYVYDVGNYKDDTSDENGFHNFKNGVFYSGINNKIEHEPGLIIERSAFTNNSSGSTGGVISLEEPMRLRVTDSLFKDNSSVFGGGAIYLHNPRHDSTIKSSYFINNSANTNGGAIMLSNCEMGTSITNSVFEGNKAAEEGGAIYSHSNVGSSIVGSTFTGNSAKEGGAIYIYTGNPRIVDSTFTGNSAERGGAIYNYSVGSIIETVNSNIVFSGNSASEAGGAIYNNSTLFTDNTSSLNLNAYRGYKIIFDAPTKDESGNVTASNDIYNIGIININGSRSGSVVVNSAVNGTGTTNIKSGGNLILGDDATFTQDNLTITSGTMQGNAGKITVKNGIANNGSLTFTGGENNNQITGTGTTYITGDDVKNKSTISQAVSVASGGNLDNTSGTINGDVANKGILTSNFSNISGTVDNDGTFNVIGGTINKAISGDGTTSITGNVSNQTTISQAVSVANTGNLDNTSGKITKNVDILSGGILTSNASNISGTVDNDGTFNVIGGTINKAISGSGTTNITGNGVVNSSTISQAVNIASAGNLDNSSGTIGGDVANSGTLTSNAGNISGSVTNDAAYNVTGGEITKAITGAGTTNITGNGVVNSSTISQAVSVASTGSLDNTSGTITGNVDILSGGSLTSDTSGLEGAINNGGSLTLSGTLAKEITGAGTTLIDKELAFADGAEIKGALDLNSGVLNLEDDTINEYSVGSLKGTGSLKIDADMSNSTSDKLTVGGAEAGTQVTVSSINITQDLALGETTESTTLTVLAGEIANVTLNADGGNGSLVSLTNDYKYEFTTGESGKLNANINKSTYRLAEYIDGTAEADSYSLVRDENVFSNSAIGTTTDDRTVYLNNNNIIGDKVNNGITAASGHTLNLSEGTIKDFVTALTNKGTLNLTDIAFEGNTTDIANSNVVNLNGTNSITGGITGSNGTTNIKNGTTTVSATIENAVNIDSGAALVNTGNGTITGAITNAGTLTSSADNIKNTVENNGTYNVEGGAIASAITGEGSLFINENTINNADIKQNSITVAIDKTLTNENSITTSALINNGTVTNTGAVTVNGNLANNGTLTNDSNLTVGGGTENDPSVISGNAITGGGLTSIEGIVKNQTTISQAVSIASTGNLDNTSGSIGGNVSNSGILTSNASNISGTVDNDGTYNVIGGTIANAITGEGSINVTANTTNNSEITQKVIQIADNVTFTNDGELISSFNLGETQTIDGAGSLTISDNSSNAGTITQNSLAVNQGKTFTNTGDVTVNGNLANNGTLTNDSNLTVGGGTENDPSVISGNAITGGGLTSIEGIVKNQTTISQAVSIASTGNLDNTSGSIGGNVSNSGILTSNASNISGTVDNDGTYNVIGGTIANAITGAGTTNITGADVKNTNTISQNVSIADTGNLDNSSGLINGNVENAGTLTSNANNISGTVANDGTYNVEGGTIANTISGSGTTNIKDSTILASEITGGTINLDNGMLTFAQNASIANAGAFNVNGGALNLQNGAIQNTNLGNLTLNSNLDLTIDGNFAQQAIDTISANSFNANGNNINISNILISGHTTAPSFSISPLGEGMDESVKTALAGAIQYTGSDIIYSPIYRYAASYDPSTAMLNVGMAGGGGYSGYNPAIMASPVAAQLGGYLVQLNSYDNAFRNMDMYMLMTKEQRQAMKFRNKYATTNKDIVFDPTITQYENKAGWFRPYATFENVSLNNVPDVSNVAYGSFFGAESELYDLGHGWDGMWGVYAGYNGSHQAYDGVSIYQNGGTFGAVGMAYKGNFFTGLTANVGASAGDASTMFGREDFTMLMSGIASKTGYNYELAEGKFIIQPSLLMSYSFINTFDYTNAAGVSISSDPLHAIQLEPGVKFIGNLKNGWQPYASVSVIWNIMDRTHFKANDVSLPNLSVDPFVKYGVGVRKSWGERFTGFFQTYITNGGRNGVGLQAGFRWTLGKSEPKQQKANGEIPELPKTQITLNNIR